MKMENGELKTLKIEIINNSVMIEYKNRTYRGAFAERTLAFFHGRSTKRQTCGSE